MTVGDAPERPLDLLRLLEVLHRHAVEFVVVGGVAVQTHGHRRTTKDLDLVPAPVRENLERLARALEELEARVSEPGSARAPMSVTDVDRLEVAAVVPPLTTVHGEVHVLKELAGLGSYEGLRSRALVIDVAGIEVTVVGLDDLIRIKRAAGRQRDLEDVEVLIEVERRARDDSR